jgi:hypothetical protein
VISFHPELGSAMMTRLAAIKIPIVISFALLSGVGRFDKAFAAEVTTECPPTKPGRPEVSFKYGEPYPEGLPLAGSASEYVEKDGLVYAKYEYAPIRPILNSVIMCQYADGSEITVRIPGELLRCEKKFREISNISPFKVEFLRVWCVSEVK